ncbi:MAG: STAS/SEC14 domain-containing protein [Betaproteobacteria bacterium]|nr:STAS/SEC14 domain-containing protein [Betaproteobacteria bacterium]
MIVIDQKAGRVSVNVYGEFTLEDFQEFEEEVNYTIRFKGPVDLCFDLREMSGMTLDVAWEDMRFTHEHALDFRRIAVISDSQLVSWSAWLTQNFVSADIEVFDAPEAAISWLDESESNDKLELSGAS